MEISGLAAHPNIVQAKIPRNKGWDNAVRESL